MPVVIGGWDSIENFEAAIARGELPAIVPENYTGPATNDAVIQPGLVLAPTSPLAQSAIPTSSGFLGTGNTMPVAVAGVMFNPVASGSFLGGAWSGFDPTNVAGGLAILHAFAESVYGSIELGVLRRSSEVLENEPTGIRPGTMERIVIPVWARNERGSPI